MSLQTWKQEFYPVPASEVPEADAIAHSLRKWIGLRKANLERHGMETNGASVFDIRYYHLPIDITSCALCAHYWDAGCSQCPLDAIRGCKCYGAAINDEPLSPFSAFRDHFDPEPMIALLEEALRRQGKEPADE